MKKFFREIYHLFIRGIKQSLRPYFALLPEFIMPIFFFVVNSAAFQKAVEIPGFAAESYLAFYAPVALLMAIFLSSGSTGLEVVTDISTGYMDRLFVAPIHRSAIIIGKLLSTGLRAMAQALIMLAFVALLGAPFKAGLAGIALLLLLAFIFGMAWSGVGLMLALFTKNPRVVQSSFVFFFPFTMMTTSQLPLELLSGWYKTVVLINPVTHILEGIRSFMLTGLDAPILAAAFIAALGFAAITICVSIWAFRRLSN